MLKSILISTVILLLFAGLTYSQTYTINEGYTTSNNEVTNTEKKVPQYLLDQLEVAEKNEDIEEENRILNILNTNYFDVTFYNSTEPYYVMVEDGTDAGAYNPPYNPDWMSSDRLVYNHSGNMTNVTKRTLDMKYCWDNGRIYIAACVNITGFHGIRVFSSGNSGLTWVDEGGIYNNSMYWTGLSMTVEQRRTGYPDSVRVNIFYTEAVATNNDNARLGFWSFKPTGTPYHIIKVIGNPTSGREFRWPSAYSDGAQQSSSTDIGCIVGEYNNSGTTLHRIRQFYMSNFSWNFSNTTINTGQNDHWPSVVWKNSTSGTDSILIATERKFGGANQIRVLVTREQGGITTLLSYRAVTSLSSGNYAKRPCFAIQNRFNPTRMVITYTVNSTDGIAHGRGRRSYNYSAGVGSWTHAYLSSSYTTRYTWVSADSNGGSGYCTFIWGDTDSLNVRRTYASGSGGSVWYDRASRLVTSYFWPVCCVYNNSSGNHRRAVFAYVENGPHDIYANAENLPTGITNTNGIANTYSLSQNFPNPFNPTTSINFSIPKDGHVNLVVYDVLGKEVATIVNEEQTAGTYQVTFDASKLTSGVYFYKITSGDFSDVKKMLLVK